MTVRARCGMMLTTEGDGNTPLDENEAAGLLPTHITTQDELNEFEQANIVEGERWARAQSSKDVLSPEFMGEVHRRMFDKTWEWAGHYRTSEKNLGIYWAEISTAMQELCDNTRFQLNNAVYTVEEIAGRFHHRLTHIHPFPNGNGRHARVMTDVFLTTNGCKRFAWGSGDLRDIGEVRAEYVAALQAADAHDFDPLFRFLGI